MIEKEIKLNKPIVYIASPYTKGDVSVNVHFQCKIFDELMDDGIVVPVVPLWSHFQHTIFPRQYKDWIAYDLALLCRYDACLRLDVINEKLNYHQHDSSGADGEVEEFRRLGKPVFFSKSELYEWVNSANVEYWYNPPTTKTATIENIFNDSDMAINSQTLSSDKINAGEDFVFEFNKIIPVSCAFWMKLKDEKNSYLYIASEKINDSNFDSAYEQVLRIVASMRKYLDPFKIRVIGYEDHLSKAAMNIKHFSSTKTIGVRLEECSFGNVFADEIYIYPDVNVVPKEASSKEFLERIKDLSTKGEFTPYAYYNESMDEIQVYFKDESCYTKPVNDKLELYLSYDNDVIGVKVLGVKKLIQGKIQMTSDKLDNTIENRILELEKHVKNPPGTSLTRVLFLPTGRGWALSLGQMSTPSHVFTGDTIESVVSQAEEHLKKYNQFQSHSIT